MRAGGAGACHGSLSLRVAGKGPFAVDFVHQLADLAQADFDFGTQRAQVGGGHARIGADRLRFDQHRIDLLQAGADVGQYGGELLHRRLGAVHGGLGTVHQALGTEHALIGLGQQGIGAVQGVDDFFGLLFAAQHAGEQAIAPRQAPGHGLQVAQAGVEAGVGAGHGVQVFQQRAGGGHQARNFGAGVAAQHLAFRIGGQRRVAQHAAECAQAGIAHHAALDGEDAGGAQPGGVLARHVDQDAGFAVGASSMRCTRPIGKPEKVRSMPTSTPSESSATSTSRCVLSNTPRAYIT